MYKKFSKGMNNQLKLASLNDALKNAKNQTKSTVKLGHKIKRGV